MRGSDFEQLYFLKETIKELKPDIICLQETRNTRIFEEKYDVYTATTRTSDGQHGTATLVKKGLGEVIVREDIPLSITIQLIKLDLKVANIYISHQMTKYKDHLFNRIQKLFNQERSIIAGDLNFINDVIEQDYQITRIGYEHEQASAIDYLTSRSLKQLGKQTKHTPSDHLLLIKDFEINAIKQVIPRVTKQQAEKYHDKEQQWFGRSNIKAKPTKTQDIKQSYLNPVDQIKEAWFRNDTKQANQLISKYIGQKQQKIVSRLKNHDTKESLLIIRNYFQQQFAGIYYGRLINKKLQHKLNQKILGTVYWRYTKRHKELSEILRNFPNDKALGPDNISDRWLKKKHNAMPFQSFIEEWINGKAQPPEWINDANLMLLSKDGTSNPPIDKTRPIAMSGALRKMMESAWMRLYSPYLWWTIHPRQIGFRPKALMGQNTAELINDIQSREYDSIWFIDVKAAFPSAILTQLMEEIDRRKQVLQALNITIGN